MQRCGEKALCSQRPASLPSCWERRAGLWVGLRLRVEPRLFRGHCVHALGTRPGLCMGGENVARWLRSIKKLMLLLPLCAVRTPVRLFLEELHFPGHPASRYSRWLARSQSVGCQRQRWPQKYRGFMPLPPGALPLSARRKSEASGAGGGGHRKGGAWVLEPTCRKIPVAARSTCIGRVHSEK